MWQLGRNIYPTHLFFKSCRNFHTSSDGKISRKVVICRYLRKPTEFVKWKIKRFLKWRMWKQRYLRDDGKLLSKWQNKNFAQEINLPVNPNRWFRHDAKLICEHSTGLVTWHWFPQSGTLNSLKMGSRLTYHKVEFSGQTMTQISTCWDGNWYSEID